MEDEALDAYAEDLAKFEKQLQDKRDRKPIKVPTDVQGISKKEYLASMVKEVDKFKDVWTQSRKQITSSLYLKQTYYCSINYCLD